MESRKSGGTSVAQVLRSLDEPMATLARDLRSLIRKAEPKLTEGIKWGMPVYEKDRLVCAIRPANGYVALQFYTSGTSLRDPDGLLEGTGKKMRHYKIRSKADLKAKLFTAWIKQAGKGS